MITAKLIGWFGFGFVCGICIIYGCLLMGCWLADKFFAGNPFIQILPALIVAACLSLLLALG